MGKPRKPGATSHDVYGGRYILAYHLDGGKTIVGLGHSLADALASAARYNERDYAGGRYAVHHLGPEVTEDTDTGGGDGG